MMEQRHLLDFIELSNAIEDIKTDPMLVFPAYNGFLSVPRLDIQVIAEFVQAIEPDGKLRVNPGMDAYVGRHKAPPGGLGIAFNLSSIIEEMQIGALSPFEVHCRYLHLHPFTDGNGRSARAIWLWQMLRIDTHLMPGDIPFLQTFYYQALGDYDERIKS